MPFNSQGQWVPENDSVANNLNGLLAKESPYIALARSGGVRSANRRGLLNSSIAAGSGEASAIAAALPIASQDASQTYGKNLTQLQATNNLLAQTQAEGATRNLSAQEYGQTKDLSNQGFEQNRVLSNQGFEQDRVLSDQGYRQNVGLTTATAGFDLERQRDAAAAALRQQSEGASQTQELQRIASASDVERQRIATSSADRSAALEAALNANSVYQTAFNNIASNADIPAATRDSYIQQLSGIRSTGLDMIQQIYGIQLSWANPTPAPAAASAYDPVSPTNNGGYATTERYPYA